MGLTPDVTAGTLIQSVWGNEIRDRTIQSFASSSQLTTWAAPPKGSLAVTLDTLTIWQWSGTAWKPLVGGMPRARVYRTTSQGMSTGTVTVNAFNTVRWNAGPMFNAGLNTRLTVPMGCAGLYAIGANVRFGYNSTGQRQIGIRLNGSTFLVIQNHEASDTIGSVSDLSCTTHYQLNAGDYIESVMLQHSTANLNSDPAANHAPEFWATWIAPTA